MRTTAPDVRPRRDAAWLAWFSLALAACLAGCQTYSAPTLRVASVEVGERTTDGQVIRIALDAENRNDVELPLREVRYALRLDGQEVFRGVRSPEASLRRLGTQRVTFPAVVPLGPGRELPRGEVAMEIDGTLEYITPGRIAEIFFDSGLRRPSVAFRDAGRVDLSAPAGGAR